MSKRAKRLAKYLEETLDWTVCDDKKKCKCGCDSYGFEKVFCAKCGEKLPPAKPRKDTITELESAISYALGEIQ